MGVVDVVTDGPLLLAAPVAVAAGLLSFLSPCVLPLVPGYLSFITGLSGEDLQRRPRPDQADQADRPDRPDRPGSSGQPEPQRQPEPAVVTGSGDDRVPVTVGAAEAATTAPAVTTPDAPGAEAAAAAVAGSDPVGGVGPGAVVRGGPSRRGGRLGDLRRTGRVTVGTGLFILGFTAVFVSYGAAFGGLGQRLVLHQVGVSQVLGAVTIVMGLAFAGVFSRMSWANREWRFHRLPSPGLLGAPALGVLFGLGWTPCIGPTLSAVLGLAAQSATAGRGAFLSAMYCLGLGLPFLVVGLAFRRVAGALLAARRHARLLAFTGGALLVTVGVLQLTGAWTDLIAELRPYAPGFSETPL